MRHPVMRMLSLSLAAMASWAAASPLDDATHRFIRVAVDPKNAADPLPFLRAVEEGAREVFEARKTDPHYILIRATLLTEYSALISRIRTVTTSSGVEKSLSVDPNKITARWDVLDGTIRYAGAPAVALDVSCKTGNERRDAAPLATQVTKNLAGAGFQVVPRPAAAVADPMGTNTPMVLELAFAATPDRTTKAVPACVANVAVGLRVPGVATKSRTRVDPVAGSGPTARAAEEDALSRSAEAASKQVIELLLKRWPRRWANVAGVTVTASGLTEESQARLTAALKSVGVTVTPGDSPAGTVTLKCTGRSPLEIADGLTVGGTYLVDEMRYDLVRVTVKKPDPAR